MIYDTGSLFLEHFITSCLNLIARINDTAEGEGDYKMAAGKKRERNKTVK